MSTSVVSHLADHTLLLVGVFQRKSHYPHFCLFCRVLAPSHVRGLLAFNLNQPSNNFSGLATDFVEVTAAVSKFCKKSLRKLYTLLCLE